MKLVAILVRAPAGHHGHVVAFARKMLRPAAEILARGHRLRQVRLVQEKNPHIPFIGCDAPKMQKLVGRGFNLEKEAA
jgi:hypothetical protein